MPSPGAGGPADPVRSTARAFRQLVDSGWELPLPGRGETEHRWRALADLGAVDLGLARLAEGHADARAVLAELGGPDPGGGCRLGVWAAEPPSARLTAHRTPAGWTLDGRKAWCSGVSSLTHALVTALDGGARRLFLVELSAPGVALDGSGWAGPGMRGSDTGSAVFTGAPCLPVGEPGEYVGRPGFWHGGIGVAAVWAGGARRVADALRASATSRDPDPLTSLAVGRDDVALAAADAVLRTAAADVDAAPSDLPAARLRALRVRAVVAAAVDDVLATAGRALGPGPLAHDAAHARHVADLTVYVRQHHGERDLAALGKLLTAGPAHAPEGAA